MLLRLWNIGSLGKRYLLASLVYVGLGLIVVSALPDLPEARASGTECDGETPCSSGEECCDGYCIPDDYVCCEDGTNGPQDTCACCAECSPTSCSQTTVQCEEE